MNFIRFFRSINANGGPIDENQILPAEGFEILMPSVPAVGVAYKQYTYRKLFVKNVSNKVLSGVRIYIKEQTPSPDDDVAIAVGTSEDTITQATTYEYAQPYSLEDALLLTSELPPGASVAVWVRRVVQEFARPFRDNYYTLAVAYLYQP